MRFLVVDPNLVYGRTVKTFIQTHMQGSEVDLAQNASIVRRRVNEHNYDFVIADILNAVDCEEIGDVLHAMEAPIVMWSFINPGGYREFAQRLHAKLLDKPRNPDGLGDILELVGCGDQHEQAEIHKAKQ